MSEKKEGRKEDFYTDVQQTEEDYWLDEEDPEGFTDIEDAEPDAAALYAAYVADAAEMRAQENIKDPEVLEKAEKSEEEPEASEEKTEKSEEQPEAPEEKTEKSEEQPGASTEEAEKNKEEPEVLENSVKEGGGEPTDLKETKEEEKTGEKETEEKEIKEEKIKEEKIQEKKIQEKKKRKKAEKIEKDKDLHLSEENKSEEEEKPRLRKKQSAKTPLIVTGTVVGVISLVLVCVYMGISVYFMSHFFANTVINGQNFSGKTVEDAEAYLDEQIAGYSLTILQKEGRMDMITAQDISLARKENDEIQSILEAQEPFKWPLTFFKNKPNTVSVEISYDETALEGRLNSLQIMKAERIAPVSAYPKFDGDKFIVEPEVTGTDVNFDMLRQKTAQYIREFKTELDMDAEQCYALPLYTSESPEVQNACAEMNRYLQANITYKMDQDVVVGKKLISDWVTVDENLQITFHEDAVRQWLEQFGNTYDTIGTTRTITTPTGKTAEVSGGTYGWGIDEDTELTALLNSIRNGETVEKEPACYPGQTAASHGPQDWGTTYVEVDRSAQHMWFVSDGAVVLETDVVTGAPSPKTETTTGVYFILEKELKKTLVGDTNPETGKPEYETPVDFWMRVTWSGIGFHDATWQSAFGGTRYRDGAGSHGCINMPYDQASALYNLVQVGTPVIIHD